MGEKGEKFLINATVHHIVGSKGVREEGKGKWLAIRPGAKHNFPGRTIRGAG